MEYLQLWFETNFGICLKNSLRIFGNWRERERERESSGTLLGISGTSVENLLVGNKIKLMCWDLRMGGRGTKNAEFNTSSVYSCCNASFFLGLHTTTRWNNGFPKPIHLTKVVEVLLKEMNHSLLVTGFLWTTPISLQIMSRVMPLGSMAMHAPNQGHRPKVCIAMPCCQRQQYPT